MVAVAGSQPHGANPPALAAAGFFQSDALQSAYQPPIMQHFGDVVQYLGLSSPPTHVPKLRQPNKSFRPRNSAMPPTRARIRFPRQQADLNKPSDGHGMTGYDALVAVLRNVQAIIDAVESWDGGSSRKISSTERNRFCIAIASSATALTDLFDSTLPNPASREPYREEGIYNEEPREFQSFSHSPFPMVKI